jgi:hypothetical protein
MAEELIQVLNKAQPRWQRNASFEDILRAVLDPETQIEEDLIVKWFQSSRFLWPDEKKDDDKEMSLSQFYGIKQAINEAQAKGLPMNEIKCILLLCIAIHNERSGLPIPPKSLEKKAEKKEWFCKKKKLKWGEQNA